MPIPVPVFIGAALATSINPRAIGILTFLLVRLTKATQGSNKLFACGLSFISGVFVAYLAVGLFILQIIQILTKFNSFIYALSGVLLVLSGLTDLKNFFLADKKISFNFFSLLPTSSARIKVYKKQISGSAQRAFFLGAFVAMAEFPFTGALYLALLSLLSLTSLTFDSLFLLLAYNLIFVSPLITTLYFFWQKKPDIIKKWTRKHKKFLSAIMGLALSLFGIWLIWLALF